MPQRVGEGVVIRQSVVPLVGSAPALPCRWAFPQEAETYRFLRGDYGLFSLVFPHEERYKPLIHQGTLRYFPKKNPERPCRACGFFTKNSLLHHPLISRNCLEKKRKNGGAALW